MHQLERQNVTRQSTSYSVGVRWLRKGQLAQQGKWRDRWRENIALEAMSDVKTARPVSDYSKVSYAAKKYTFSVWVNFFWWKVGSWPTKKILQGSLFEPIAFCPILVGSKTFSGYRVQDYGHSRAVASVHLDRVEFSSYTIGWNRKSISWSQR